MPTQSSPPHKAQALLQRLRLNHARHATGLDAHTSAVLPRWLLWMALLVLLGVTLATLAWLVSRYEVNRAQQHLQADALAASAQLRQALLRNVGDMERLARLDLGHTAGVDRALAGTAAPVRWTHWPDQARDLLKLRREMLWLELRPAAHETGLVIASAQARWDEHIPPPTRAGEAHARAACQSAAIERRAVYSQPYFAWMNANVGLQLIDVCVPIVQAGRTLGLARATYSLRALLLEHVWSGIAPLQQVSLLDADGQTLAVVGVPIENARTLSQRQSLPLSPGVTLLLQLEGWRTGEKTGPVLATSGFSGDLSGLGELGGWGAGEADALGDLHNLPGIASATADSAFASQAPPASQVAPSAVLQIPASSWLAQVLPVPSINDWLARVGWELSQWLSALLVAVSLTLLIVVWMLVRDSQSRHRIQQELAQSLAMRQAMENALTTGVRVTDPLGRTTYVNPSFCQLVGWTAAELLAAHVPPYWPPEHVAEYAKRLAQLIADKREFLSRGREATLLHRDGQRLPVLVFETPLIDAQGQHLGWITAFVDLREQRRLQALNQASQERLQAIAPLVTAGEMASTISHEITQPLMAISSYANGSLNLLSAPPVDADWPGAADPIDTLDPPALRQTLRDLRQAMQRISTQAERAGQVIKSVRNFLRQKTSDGSRTRTTAAALLDAVMPLIVLQTQKSHIELVVHLPQAAAQAPIVCDAILIEQVLLNLARNAVQAMQEQSAARRVLTLSAEIHVGPSPLCPGLADEARHLTLSVADLGTGIAPEAAEHIFSPFFTTRAEGMGLGLNLCRTIVEQHGGALLHRPGREHGTVFSFALPIEPDQPQPQSLLASAPAPLA